MCFSRVPLLDFNLCFAIGSCFLSAVAGWGDDYFTSEVGKMGGSAKLFEERQKRIKEKWLEEFFRSARPAI